MRKTKEKTTVVFGLGQGEEEYFEQLAKSQVKTLTGEGSSEPTESQSLAKSILNTLNSQDGVHRISFETDPRQANNYAGIYRPKVRLVPDTILKRIAIQDSLVASIVRTRQNHLSSFGRPRPDQFSKGFIIKPNTGVLDKLSEEEKDRFSSQIDRAIKVLSSCGYTEQAEGNHQHTFAEYLGLSVRSAIVCGRLATEIVWADDPTSNQRKFSHFVCVDAGTIYKATTDTTGQESIRQEAYHLLCKLTGKTLDKEKSWNEEGKYSWVQVVDGTPTQVFTDKELKVYNFYPVPDVEVDNYPVTPIDTVITAITTHINITTHNKTYFQSGRATRGMLVIKSDDASKQLIHQIKQQFNASINGASAAWRMPVFGVPTSGEINWQPIDAGGGRDMEFQYLADMNAREIMSAFMMGPDELPGWSYLSRGTASQALSESNNEWRLTAARDVGIRPLLASFEDFINAELLPLIDADLAKKARVCLVGLDAQTPEKQAVELQTGGSVYMSFDDILQRVEKKPVGREWAGEIPLNPVYKSYLDQYFTLGQVLEHFCGIKGASKDPTLAYRKDPMWFQWQQMLMQQQQLQQQAQQQAQQGQPPPQGGQDQQQDQGQGESQQVRQNPQDDQTENQRNDQMEESTQKANDLGKAIGQAFDLMQKSEDNLPPEKRKILDQHKKTVKFLVDGFDSDIKNSVREILDIADKLGPHE